jgi:hypothetical protein
MTGVLCATAGVGGDATPDPVNWANIGFGVSPQSNADQTISGISSAITLRATLSAGFYDAGPKAFSVYKNSAIAGSVTPANGATLDVSVSNGDTVHYEATKGLAGSGTTWNATVTVANVNTGATLDTFTADVEAPP